MLCNIHLCNEENTNPFLKHVEVALPESVLFLLNQIEGNYREVFHKPAVLILQTHKNSYTSDIFSKLLLNGLCANGTFDVEFSQTLI